MIFITRVSICRRNFHRLRHASNIIASHIAGKVFSFRAIFAAQTQLVAGERDGCCVVEEFHRSIPTWTSDGSHAARPYITGTADEPRQNTMSPTHLLARTAHPHCCSRRREIPWDFPSVKLSPKILWWNFRKFRTC